MIYQLMNSFYWSKIPLPFLKNDWYLFCLFKCRKKNREPLQFSELQLSLHHHLESRLFLAFLRLWSNVVSSVMIRDVLSIRSGRSALSSMKFATATSYRLVFCSWIFAGSVLEFFYPRPLPEPLWHGIQAAVHECAFLWESTPLMMEKQKHWIWWILKPRLPYFLVYWTEIFFFFSLFLCELTPSPPPFFSSPFTRTPSPPTPTSFLFHFARPPSQLLPLPPTLFGPRFQYIIILFFINYFF